MAGSSAGLGFGRRICRPRSVRRRPGWGRAAPPPLRWPGGGRWPSVPRRCRRGPLGRGLGPVSAPPSPSLRGHGRGRAAPGVRRLGAPSPVGPPPSGLGPPPGGAVLVGGGLLATGLPSWPRPGAAPPPPPQMGGGRGCAAAASGPGAVGLTPPPRGRGLVAAAAASSVGGAARPGLPSSPVAASGGQGRLAASSPPRVVGEGRLLSSDLCWD